MMAVTKISNVLFLILVFNAYQSFALPRQTIDSNGVLKIYTDTIVLTDKNFEGEHTQDSSFVYDFNQITMREAVTILLITPIRNLSNRTVFCRYKRDMNNTYVVRSHFFIKPNNIETLQAVLITGDKLKKGPFELWFGDSTESTQKHWGNISVIYSLPKVDTIRLKSTAIKNTLYYRDSLQCGVKSLFIIDFKNRKDTVFINKRIIQPFSKEKIEFSFTPTCKIDNYEIEKEFKVKVRSKEKTLLSVKGKVDKRPYVADFSIQKK